MLIEIDETYSFYEAQLRAARARSERDSAYFWHWAKVAAEVARRSPVAEMDERRLEAILAEDARCRTTPQPERRSARDIVREL